MLLRQAVHTGHFPVAELLACGGRVCRCNDGVALFGCRCGAAIDGKGAAFNGNAQQLLILCDGGHRLIRHDKGGLFLILFSHSNIAVVHFPAVEHIARTMIRSNGNFRALFCRGDICPTIYHFNCMELCVLRVQGNIAFRHLEGDPVLVDLHAQINAGRVPFFKLQAVLVRCPSFDGLPLKSLVCCYVIHLDDSSIIVGGDGVVLLVIRGQGHALVRHGKVGFFCFQLVSRQHAVRVSPVGKLCVFSVCCGHGDLFARKGSLQFCPLPLQLDGCIFCSIDVVERFLADAHIARRDSTKARVNKRVIGFAGIVDRAFRANDRACNAAVTVVFQNHRAGAFNFHIATDRSIALAFDLHTCRAVYGKVFANSRPSIVIRFNGQRPGAGNIYISLNR